MVRRSVDLRVIAWQAAQCNAPGVCLWQALYSKDLCASCYWHLNADREKNVQCRGTIKTKRVKQKHVSQGRTVVLCGFLGTSNKKLLRLNAEGAGLLPSFSKLIPLQCW